MKFIWSYIRKDLYKIIFAAILGSLSGISLVWAIKEFHQVIDDGIDDAPLFFGKVAGYIFTYTLFAIISERILMKVSGLNLLKMRMDISSRVFTADYEVMEASKSKIYTSLMADIGALARVSGRLPAFIKNLVISVGGLIYMATLNVHLSLAVLGIFLVIFGHVMLRNQKMVEISLATRKISDKVNHTLHDIIYGVKELSLNARTTKHYIQKQLRNVGMEEYHARYKVGVLGQITSKSNETFLLLGTCMVIVMSLYFDQLTMAGFTKFLTILLFIISPISGVSNFIKGILPIKATLTHISDIGLSLEDSGRIKQQPENPFPSNASITIKDLEYEYPDNQDTQFHLGPINMKIAKNKITVIKGGNGSGKTTVSKLVTGLYKPVKGNIELGGVEVKDINITHYRNLFSAVFTDHHLLSFKDFKPEDKPKADELLETFNLTSLVSFQDGQFTIGGLSTGQLKRLSLIYALLEDRDIFLFDEWAANQDPSFKREFYYGILSELKASGKTIILITHDEHYFDVADAIYSLWEGKMDDSWEIEKRT